MGAPIAVEVLRGDVREALHRVHAVVVQDGRTLLEAGDSGLTACMRSAAKPIQALPLVREAPELDSVEVAIACASHLARPEQVGAVRRLLARAGAAVGDLETGPEPTPLEHNCSGKHAGFLLLCRLRGWPFAGYRLAAHPCQQAMLAEVAAAHGVDTAEIVTAVDGCGVVTFALSLGRMAAAFAALPERDGAAVALAAMRAHPELIRGPLAADSMLMREARGWTAKGGAEGLLCASGPGGLGVALKVEDGETRAVAAALAEVLRRLGFEPPPALVATQLANSRGERIGEIRAASRAPRLS